jgi:type III secretion system regulator LcrR
VQQEIEDPIRPVLAAQGVEAVPKPARPGSPLIDGYRIEIKGLEIVYRMWDPETCLLVLVRRLDQVGGLRNPFAGLIWFVELVKANCPSVKRVAGKVDTSNYTADAGLDDDRLRGFYALFETYLAAVPLNPVFPSVWVCLELADYRPLRENLRRRREMGARTRLGGKAVPDAAPGPSPTG